jgi:hypothetical protein
MKGLKYEFFCAIIKKIKEMKGKISMKKIILTAVLTVSAFAFADKEFVTVNLKGKNSVERKATIIEAFQKYGAAKETFENIPDLDERFEITGMVEGSKITWSE